MTSPEVDRDRGVGVAGEWVVPTIRGDGRPLGFGTISDPSELAGRRIVTVEATPCLRVYANGRDLCPLVQGHRGACWQASPALVHELTGALAVEVQP